MDDLIDETRTPPRVDRRAFLIAGAAALGAVGAFSVVGARPAGASVATVWVLEGEWGARYASDPAFATWLDGYLATRQDLALHPAPNVLYSNGLSYSQARSNATRQMARYRVFRTESDAIASYQSACSRAIPYPVTVCGEVVPDLFALAQPGQSFVDRRRPGVETAWQLALAACPTVLAPVAPEPDPSPSNPGGDSPSHSESNGPALVLAPMTSSMTMSAGAPPVASRRVTGALPMTGLDAPRLGMIGVGLALCGAAMSWRSRLRTSDEDPGGYRNVRADGGVDHLGDSEIERH